MALVMPPSCVLVGPLTGIVALNVSLRRIRSLVPVHTSSCGERRAFAMVRCSAAEMPCLSTRVACVPVDETSEIEFDDDENSDPADPADEVYVMEHGIISLKDLVEEELLLAVPVVPTHGASDACGTETQEQHATTRPFAALQDLLKKT